MAAKILAELWDHAMTKCESHTSFADVEAFLVYAVELKRKAASGRLRVHIPGSITATEEQQERITALGIENF